MIKAHKLHHFLLNPSIIVKFLALYDANRNQHLKPGNNKTRSYSRGSNPQFLTKCSRVSLDGSFHGCYSINSCLLLTTHKCEALPHRSELHHTRLENCNNSVLEFLLCIQTLIGSINAVGEPIVAREHLDVILKGLLFLRISNRRSTLSLASLDLYQFRKLRHFFSVKKPALIIFRKRTISSTTANLTISSILSNIIPASTSSQFILTQ